MSEAFAALQRLLPQHGLSRLIGRLARSELGWIRRPFIHGFARAYDVSLDEAEIQDLDQFGSFNDFFTRALKRDARPIDPEPSAVLCPADGTLSQAGSIEDGELLQAKGHRYSLAALVAGSARQCAPYRGGTFFTVYLAPHDYHRVHAPATGTLSATTAIPGALYSVNARTEATIPNLFARNERLACEVQTAHGPMLVVLVGALIVASIETVWDGPQSPYQSLQRRRHDVPLTRGAELGRFLLGSTVVVCFPRGAVALARHVRAGNTVRMGQTLGHFL